MDRQNSDAAGTPPLQNGEIRHWSKRLTPASRGAARVKRRNLGTPAHREEHETLSVRWFSRIAETHCVASVLNVWVDTVTSGSRKRIQVRQSGGLSEGAGIRSATPAFDPAARPVLAYPAGAHVLDALSLISVLLLSVILAMGAARVVLGVLLHVMRLTAVRPPSEALVPRTTTDSARRFSIRQDPMTSHDGVVPLVAREAA
jgi:hypothetical protein